MPASFLHGVETIEVTTGARTISTVKTAVVGIVGTAPIEDVQEEYKTINAPTLILNEVEAVKYFGNHKAGYTIPQALKAIFDQGAGIAIVINVYDPDKHESVEDVAVSDINGGIDAETGKRTGMKAFEDCYSLFGYYPKTIIAPVYCEDAAVMDNVDNRPYWEYVAVLDNRTRPEHAQLHGLIYRYDDPFWASFYPPNGWRCRCRVNALSDYNLKKKDAKPGNSTGTLSQEMRLVSKKSGEYKPVTVYTDPLTGKKIAPDVGWSHNPASGLNDI